jgi:hypothetical protein
MTFKSSNEILNTLETTFGVGTYHEVERDEGVVVICFYADEPETADHGSDDDDLVLSDYEKGYLTAFYKTDAHIQNEHSGRDEDNDWYGIQVGERMFDLCVWKEEGAESEVCVVYECFLNDDGFWNTNTERQWFLK